MTAPVHRVLERARRFAADWNLRMPVLMAPMAGASPPALAAAVGAAGGMGACGALMLPPDHIAAWCQSVRAATDAPFQINLWIPEPTPYYDPGEEAGVRAFLADWGPEPPADAAARATLPDFAAQCAAICDLRPAAVSSVMGLYAPAQVARFKAAGIKWIATVTTVAEARAAAAAGADALAVQGAEAGGHRGSFTARHAEAALVGLFALLPAVAAAVDLPLLAAGGIADGPRAAAALMLGASAVIMGSALLRSPEAGIHPAWADALAQITPEDTVTTRAFSGRLGRSLNTRYVKAWASPAAPQPAPYPLQRALARRVQAEGARTGDIDRLQAWAGQAAGLAEACPAAEIIRRLWAETEAALTV